jgi:UDP-N-acetyl-D-galactosamine dehydrogenase
LEKENKIAIIGLGYVGLPLALSAHYKVVGYDVNEKRILDLSKGIDNNFDVAVKVNSNLIFSYDKSDLKESNIYIITVPTPVDDKNVPDLSFLKLASEVVANFLKEDDIVIYESTV